MHGPGLEGLKERVWPLPDGRGHGEVECHLVQVDGIGRMGQAGFEHWLVLLCVKKDELFGPEAASAAVGDLLLAERGLGQGDWLGEQGR